ncbi:lipid-binding SYLF domain-containing protein [Methylococcus geothermalis]|uniref:lipid-binding SYLF domain-containing protein n=1 Tax=Methylococcus geothermalis TaxID=2681310 RepID=UPI001E5F5E5E|nr:lipid-binding SYLF domain-containing protein [Methylococcus geothermalis]
MKRLVLLAVLCASGLAGADDRDKANDLLRDATITFNEFVADPNMGWFRDNVKDARALVIAPQVLKLGFIFGGSGGNAVVLVKDKQTGEWGYPAFYTAGAVTAGLQIGGELTDVIMMVMTEGGMNALLIPVGRMPAVDSPHPAEPEKTVQPWSGTLAPLLHPGPEGGAIASAP